MIFRCSYFTSSSVIGSLFLLRHSNRSSSLEKWYEPDLSDGEDEFEQPNNAPEHTTTKRNAANLMATSLLTLFEV